MMLRSGLVATSLTSFSGKGKEWQQAAKKAKRTKESKNESFAYELLYRERVQKSIAGEIRVGHAAKM